MKRTPITFLVPRRLRPASTRITSALVRGVLKRDGSRLVCEVTELKPVPGDLDRLERGLSSLTAKDFEKRKAWARWAERRAGDFKDEALLERARAVEADALRIEARHEAAGVDAPEEWLAMARDARRRRVPEPGPSELVHRALRAKLASATTRRGRAGRDQGRSKRSFPNASTDRESSRVNLAQWLAPYANDPASTYHSAPPEVRKALDRRLWAEATERSLDLQNDRGHPIGRRPWRNKPRPCSPKSRICPTQLIAKAVGAGRQELAPCARPRSRHWPPLCAIGSNSPTEALELLRDWLKIQRDRLSDTDADGPLVAGRPLRGACCRIGSRPWSCSVKHGESTRIPKKSPKRSAAGDSARCKTNGSSRFRAPRKCGRQPEKPDAIRAASQGLRGSRPHGSRD